MADFLSKMPKLAIFDNFRSMMKEIWRAWMSKQVKFQLYTYGIEFACITLSRLNVQHANILIYCIKLYIKLGRHHFRNVQIYNTWSVHTFNVRLGSTFQALTLHQQLEAGVRYFDLHVTKYRGALYGEHGLFTKQLKQYLKQMVLFLEDHPKEVLILHFKVNKLIPPAIVLYIFPPGSVPQYDIG